MRSRLWFPVLLVLLFLRPSLLFAGEGEAESRATAKSLYEEGIARAKAGEFEASLQAFEEAYRLQPHPLVLFNIARAQEELGWHQEALDSFGTYLESTNGSVDAKRRAEVDERMQELRLRLQTRVSDEEKPQIDGSVAPLPLSDEVETEAMQVEMEPPKVEPLVTDGHKEPVAVEERSAQKSRALPSLAIATASAGLAGLGTSLGLHLWNHGRFRQWKREVQHISSLPSDDPERPQLQHASNARLSSIHEVDKVSLIVAGTSAVVLATGTALWLMSRRAKVGVGLGRVEIYGQF